MGGTLSLPLLIHLLGGTINEKLWLSILLIESLMEVGIYKIEEGIKTKRIPTSLFRIIDMLKLGTHL